MRKAICRYAKIHLKSFAIALAFIFTISFCNSCDVAKELANSALRPESNTANRPENTIFGGNKTSDGGNTRNESKSKSSSSSSSSSNSQKKNSSDPGKQSTSSLRKAQKTK